MNLSVTLCAWISQCISPVVMVGNKCTVEYGVLEEVFYSYTKWHLFSETVNKSNLFLLSFVFHIYGHRGITLDDLFHFIFGKATVRTALLWQVCACSKLPSTSIKKLLHLPFWLRMLKNLMQMDRTGATVVTFSPPKSVIQRCTKMLPFWKNSFHFHATLTKFSFCEAKTSVTLSGAQ